MNTASRTEAETALTDALKTAGLGPDDADKITRQVRVLATIVEKEVVAANSKGTAST